jgi:hypothetical protein
MNRLGSLARWLVLLLSSPALLIGAQRALEPVTGKGCYTQGDDDTPRKARAGALAQAEDEAVKSDSA